MSKRLDVIVAVKALVKAALPSADIAGFDGALSQTVRAGMGGTVIGRPAEEAPEPAVDLCPPTYHYDYPIAIELLGASGTASPAVAAALDSMAADIGAAVEADRTLGGLCDWLEATMPGEADGTPPGAETQRFMSFAIIASFSTTNPLT